MRRGGTHGCVRGWPSRAKVWPPLGAGLGRTLEQETDAVWRGVVLADGG